MSQNVIFMSGSWLCLETWMFCLGSVLSHNVPVSQLTHIKHEFAVCRDTGKM